MTFSYAAVTTVMGMGTSHLPSVVAHVCSAALALRALAEQSMLVQGCVPLGLHFAYFTKHITAVVRAVHQSVGRLERTSSYLKRQPPDSAIFLVFCLLA